MEGMVCFGLLFLLLLGIAFSRLLKVLLVPDSRLREDPVPLVRLRQLEYRIDEVLQELKAIRSLLESREEPKPKPPAEPDERITTPPHSPL